MNILDRIRLALLRRELRALQSVDRAERDQAMTTADMMQHVFDRTAKVVELQNRIRAIEGVEDEPESEFGDAKIPSSMFIPTRDQK